jgi:Polyketide cyclase / dehydrase and lipid transport
MARVFVSSVINGKSDRVWARVRDFNGMPNWHPAIAESRIEGGEPSDKIGCVRDFRLRNGDRIREKLLGLSDFDMFCTYAILESPMGVENYVATLRLTPVTDSPILAAACFRAGSTRSSGRLAVEHASRRQEHHR